MAETPYSLPQTFRVDGQVAVITGGADGIGRMAALTLAEAGARVAVTDIDGDAAAATAAHIRDLGWQAEAYTLDVADREAVVATFAGIAEREGRIDILINNAGIAKREPTADVTLETWDKVVAVNQTAVFLCSREAGKAMLKQKSGCIVNIASMMGLVGGGFYPNLPYHATKGAVVNMTRALAAEWAPHGIRVNAIAPTFVKTKLTAGLQADPTMMAEIRRRTPIARMAEVEEMAGGILFLSSAASSMVTGHTLAIDGGWTAV
ncbi:MAG: NAD-dependent dehydratase [Rhodospirillaceae bacterium]|nr:NAD-dependent dehydratase [Rhodospirillaceae bacterium]